MKSATSSPRPPKLKGSRSTQSVGAQSSTMTMSTESGMLLRLIDAQRARKIAEEDKKRLNNRVKQLLKEEEKAKKRISETKKRAEEILSLKRRNELRVREKQAQRQEMEEHIIVLNKNKVKLKADHAKKKDRAHRDLVRVKKQLSQETRNESMQHERALHQQRKLAQRRALETRESIRKSKSEAAAKLAKMKVKHMSNVKEDYLGRLDTELSHLRATEEELNSMTMLEMELIQRLQDKQREQENAYTKLEQVLGIAQHTKAGSPQARKGAPPPVSAATSVAPSPMAPQARLKRPGTADSPAPPQPQPPQDGAAGGYEEPTDDEISAKFGLLDGTGAGFICTSDVSKLLNSLGLNLSESQVDQARSQRDQSNSGQISFGEFFLWWKG